MIVGNDVIQATYPTDQQWLADVRNVLPAKRVVHLTPIADDVGKQRAADVAAIGIQLARGRTSWW